MCGLAGFLDRSAECKAAELRSLAGGMATALLRRGPDDQGVWVDAPAGIALGFRRLSIIDLSPEGHQPMESACGRYVIVFNGEVYNAGAIRRELEADELAPAFRGHSDTEVMLAAIAAWGLHDAVKRFVGMFAFALWDQHERALHLVRDRLGIKPLYYAWAGETFLFGSELQALRAHPRFSPEINPDSLALFLRHNYIPAPYCIYRGVFKLPPGMILSLYPSSESHPEPTAFWSLGEIAENGRTFSGSDAEAADRLDELLREAIALRMIADVPLGAFLSGGIDSSTVVALMQTMSGAPVRTFSIGFHEAEFDEAPFARAVAQHLRSDHTEVYLGAQDALAVIPKLPSFYTEPFADSSQIPTFLVSEMARRHVTVSLSGDGGDELFGGYDRYVLARKIWERCRRTPRPLRQAAAHLLNSASTAVARRSGGSLSDRLRKLADLLPLESRQALFHTMMSYWKCPETLVQGAQKLSTPFMDPSLNVAVPDFTDFMMLIDSITWLPEDVLAKVDRASMAVSLEARVPLLDHRIVEFAWSLPLELKIRNGQGKWLLRQVLHRYVPAEMFDRRKMGFSVPIAAWLRGPLREWAEELLDEGHIQQSGLLRAAPIRQRWAEHLQGARDWRHSLWGVLMFQAWLAENHP